MKKLLCCLLIIFVWLNVSFSQNPNSKTHQMGETFASFMKLSHQQLFDTAKFFFEKNSIDTALICYNIINNAPESSDSIHKLLSIKSLSMTGLCYFKICDFSNAYKYLTDALILSEKFNIESELYKIYNNLGNIYFTFAEDDKGMKYLNKSLSHSNDSAHYFVVINNIAAIERENGNMDSALIYHEKTLKFGYQTNSKHLSMFLSNTASTYKKMGEIDSAIYYLRSAINEAKKINEIQTLVESYSDLGITYYEMNQLDSALFFLNLSNLTAITEKQYINVMTENYMIMSKIEEAKGNKGNALEYLKKYFNLNDSIYNNNILSDINQIERQYEVSKTNKQIEELIFEQKIKERTIYYQKIIGMIAIGVLLLVIFVLFVIILQRKKLVKAYKILVDKNVEIIQFQQKVPISETFQQELLHRIVTLMESNPIIFNVNFTIDELSKLVQSNKYYVSQVINTHSNHNFRSFINHYRIRKAQQLFSEPDAVKYSIEYVANRVGFKSRNAFHDAFKEITGVSPSFYVKSIHAKKNI
ncbi:MAG: helix-turn-helix domain-containing protein [Lentimicrobiaceae bacterium]|nr:helix-turn-helix domain-containing protein [Lentimicrobiaceae bacterium]